MLTYRQRRKSILPFSRSSAVRGQPGRWRGFLVFSLLLCLLLSACREEAKDGLPAPVKNTRVFEFKEKILIRAIASLLKERGFEDPKVDMERGTVETDYYVQGDFRTRVEAKVKKISRREGEVTLSVITEQESSSGWKPKNMLDKDQYDKFFDEIEMQAYRELAKAE